MDSKYDSDPEWRGLIDRQESEVLKSFIGIVVKRPTANPEESVLIYSAFVVDISGTWFLLTAAHVIEQLQHLAQHEPDSVFQFLPFHGKEDSITFFDPRTPLQLTSSQLVSFLPADHPDTINASSVFEKSDLGFIELSCLYSKSLHRTGVTPLTEEHMPKDEESFDIEDYLGHTYTAKLIGTPSKAFKVNLSAGVFECWLLRLPVEPVGASHPLSYWLPTWKDDVSRDVKGTSGGPIFLFGGRWPMLVGVQIAQDWLDGSRRYIAADPTWLLAFLRKYKSQPQRKQ